MKLTLLPALLLVLILPACDGPTSTLILPTALRWEQLNPARGDQSPQAATLWGDRVGPGPAGFLLKPADGFSSPPHIHGTTYYGIVISGTIHNDHPDAPDEYLEPGSFWIQPENGLHITACRGECLAYIEVDDQFDVQPAENAKGDAAAVTALPASEIKWAPFGIDSQIAILQSAASAKQPSRVMIKLESGFSGSLRDEGDQLLAVVIQGNPGYKLPGDDKTLALEPGTFFGSRKGGAHDLTCEDKAGCVLYVTSGEYFRIVPVED